MMIRIDRDGRAYDQERTTRICKRWRMISEMGGLAEKQVTDSINAR